MASAFNLTLGPIINSGFFAVFFFGVITMQTDEYIRNHFRNDLRFVKYFVRLSFPSGTTLLIAGIPVDPS
ncbi:hypothetical protein C8R47DRAFT_1227159 [Mycena vitilis]|nr:hypothetical protein C8R47DRAFT_1227159 [Mycena vitilis]